MTVHLKHCIERTIAFWCLVLTGCSGNQNEPEVHSLLGGAPAVGGNGSVDTGANTNSKGGTNGGATIASNQSGGSGTVATGSSLGGALGQGGLIGLGGAATNTGGRIGGGGQTPTEPPRGGSAMGGNSGNGGTKSLGGATAAMAGAGNKVNGGASSTPGSAVGGRATGGGAAATGGKSTGGKPSGGTTAAGGTGSGGKNPGGAPAGGVGSTSTSNAGTTPIKIWIAGDSTVQNCSSSCPCGWGSAMAPLFNKNVTVVNSAVGGRSIQTWLYESAVSSSAGSNGECTLTSTTYNSRWTAMTNASTGMKTGDYLLIAFGINDGDSSCPRHVGTTLYKTYLGTMAKAAQSVGAFPVFLTPTNSITCSGSKVTANRGFITETKAAGADNSVPVIDLNQLSIELYTKLGFCPNNEDYASGALGAFFCEDHTHFEAAGAAQIAGLIAQALKDQGIGLAAYLL